MTTNFPTKSLIERLTDLSLKLEEEDAMLIHETIGTLEGYKEIANMFSVKPIYRGK